MIASVSESIMLRRAEFVGIDLLKEIYMTASKLQHTQFQSRAWKCHQERFRNIIFDIFTHGLKWLTKKKSFWGLVEEVTHSGVVNDIKRHSGSSDYKHWCMIWVMQVMDEGTLSCYLMSMNEAMLAKFYNSDALLRDSHFFSNLLTVTQDLDQNTHDKREKHNNKDAESHDECLPSMGFPDSYDPFKENFTERIQEDMPYSLPDKMNARHMSNANCEPAKTNSAPYHFDTYKNTYLNDESILPSMKLTIRNRKSSASLSQNSKNSKMPNSKNHSFLSNSSLSNVCDYNPLNAMFKISLNGKTCRSLSTGEMVSETKEEKRRNSDGSTMRSQFEELLRYSLGLGSSYPKYINDSSSSSSLSDLSEDTKVSESPLRSTITDTALSMLGIKTKAGGNKSSGNAPKVYRPANYLGSISSPDMSYQDKILAASIGSTSDNAITNYSMKETKRLNKGILKRPSTEKLNTANLSLLSGNGLIPIDPKPSATKEVCSAIRGLNSLPCKATNMQRVSSMIESRPNHTNKSFSSSSTSSSSSSLKTPMVTLNPVEDNEVVTPRQFGKRHGNKNNRKSWPSYQGPPLDISEEMSDLSLLKSSLLGRDRNLVKLVQRQKRSYSFDKNSIFEDVDGVEPGRIIMGSNRLSNYSFNSSSSFVSVGSPSNESYNSMFTSLESFVSACDASAKTAPVNGSTSAESFATVNDSSTEIVSVNGSTSAESFMTVGDTISEHASMKNSTEPQQILQNYRHKNQQMQKSILTLTPPFPQPFSSSSSSPSSPLLSYEDNQTKGHINACTDSSLSVNVDCGSDALTPEDEASIPSNVTTPRQSYIEDSDQVSLSSSSTSDGSQLAGECPFIFNCNISRAVKLTLSSTCPTCHCSLVAEFNPRMPRKCSYDGQYYCDRDHINDTFYIPAEMVFNWKFERFKVSRQNYEFLTSWFDQPVIDMNALCARLHYYVTPLHNVRDQRQYLRYLHGILNVCKSIDAENILSQWPSSYVYENEDLYSMHDLVKVDSGEMYSYLDSCISISSKHIRKCDICKMEATVCKMCNAEPVLLTYDRNAAVCSRCGDLVHKSCLPFSGVCTICEIPRGTPEDINKHCAVM